MPNFSFLARTEAEIANWLPEGVNNDSKGGQEGGVNYENYLKKISLQVSSWISAL